MNLSELLGQADLPGELTFKDDKGNEFKLSDLRAFGSGVSTEKEAAVRQRQEAERVGKEAQDMLAALEAAMGEVQKAKPKKEEANNARDWRKNPLYDEIVPVLEGYESQLKSVVQMANEVKKSLDMSQAIYATERLRRQWAEASLKPQNMKFEDAVKQVLERKDMDSMGLPTLERLLHDSTEPDRLKTAVDEAVKKARTEWEQTSRIASVKPGSGTRFSTKKAGEPPIKKLDELTSEKVSQDPEIVELENQMHNIQ